MYRKGAGWKLLNLVFNFLIIGLYFFFEERDRLKGR